MLQTLRYFIREALVGFYRARAMNLITVGIIAASLAILGGFLLLVENVRVITEEWNRVQINAYFRDEAIEKRPEQVRAFVSALQSRPAIREVRFISRQEALEIFRTRFTGLAAAAGALQVNPFPASVEISVRGERDKRLETTRALVEELKASPLVEMVQDSEEEARRLVSILAVLSGIGLAVGGVLALASVFIIFNVIRLTVQARRDEISIMRLVGATAGFIRGPFLMEGMLQGLLGALAALGILYAGHLALADYAARSGNALAGLLGARFLPAAATLALAACGLVIGLIGSALSLRRFLSD
ncbi:MAG TPA: permease-like cell division protein FtsX [Candidatus Polarisedimenticolia bacterium]|jgi:cell division transport system permease protein